MAGSIAFNLLFILHLIGLVMGGATSIGMGVMGGLMPNATPDQRAGYFKLGNILARNARVAIGVLLVTGPLMLWLRYGDPRGLSGWFWVKMALVVVLVVAVVISQRAYRRVQEGDTAAAVRARQAGMVGGLSLLGIIVAAVFTFS